MSYLLKHLSNFCLNFLTSKADRLLEGGEDDMNAEEHLH